MNTAKRPMYKCRAKLLSSQHLFVKPCSQGAHDKSQTTEERCEVKASCTVLEQRWGQ
jgi:hypothetical protein